MIISALLPSREHYQVKKRSDDRLLLCDRRSDRFEVSIPIDSPWGKTWKIAIQESHNKSDKADYLAKVRFKCVEIAEKATHTIERQEYKAIVPAGYSCEFHYLGTIGPNLWLDYSIIFKEKISCLLS